MNALGNGPVRGAVSAAAQPLLRIIALAWAFVAGTLGWVIQLGDSPSGRGNDESWLLPVLLFYLTAGLVFALLNPKHWKWATLCAWAIALTWISGPWALRYPDGMTWALRMLGTMVVVPLIGLLLGGFAGMRCRGYVDPLFSRGLR